jgi:regulation of enolase protein 1 (concanavalin A-like superfamily)
MPDVVTLTGGGAGLGPLDWVGPAAAAGQELDGVLWITAGPRTDLFIDPGNGATTLNAPRLLGARGSGDFQLSAKVQVEFAGDFDAGVLLLWADETSWAKLCFEISPQGQPMVVSVMTRDVSDDANGFAVDGDTVWLRISAIGRSYAFHASRDGGRWDFVRHFHLPTIVQPQVGFEVQSPVGEGCRATFSDILFSHGTLADLRDGR